MSEQVKVIHKLPPKKRANAKFYSAIDYDGKLLYLAVLNDKTQFGMEDGQCYIDSFQTPRSLTTNWIPCAYAEACRNVGSRPKWD